MIISSTLLHRQRLSLKIRFRLRFGQTIGDKPRQLYIRLSVDGQTTSDYASGVYVRPDQWYSAKQRVLGSSKLALEINHELETIEAEHKNLLAELLRLKQAGVLPTKPSAETVKHHWTRKTTLIPTLLEGYDTYVKYLRGLEGTPDAREKRTLDKWQNGRSYLADYITQQKSERLTVDLLTRKWAEGFYYYLIKRPLGQATAARFVGYLRASINHLVETQKVSDNPIAGYFPDKGKDKPVYFLEQAHIDQLWNLESTNPTTRLVKDWLLLMCYTGMDQPDLERYVKEPGRYHQVTEAGVMIAIPRGKTALIACIPLLDEVKYILANYPAGIPTLTNQTINDYTRTIQELIGFDKRLTTKICRKTAGFLFICLGYRIEEVSKVLGHSSIQTTLRHYVTTTGSMVKAGMLRVKKDAVNHIRQPFTSIYKAS
ncbi:phage integrase SAM-like domain-containing protein [Spirosoma panaciterrae]|uniref:phage integrase SAM-like domain-containing protein n=1 Tax=Spirosoma panaciterrae TaxID=496058 RepID=UPI000360EF43|nr:phage integrase SAM-like domain-containing protein [Spirosoma panaciterrae]